MDRVVIDRMQDDKALLKRAAKLTKVFCLSHTPSYSSISTVNSLRGSPCHSHSHCNITLTHPAMEHCVGWAMKHCVAGSAECVAAGGCGWVGESPAREVLNVGACGSQLHGGMYAEYMYIAAWRYVC